MNFYPIGPASYSQMESKYLGYNMRRAAAFKRAVHRAVSGKTDRRARAMIAALKAYAKNYEAEFGTCVGVGCTPERNAGFTIGYSWPGGEAPADPPPFVWSEWWPSWSPDPPPE